MHSFYHIPVFPDFETFTPVVTDAPVKQEVKAEAEDSTDTVKQENQISNMNNNSSFDTHETSQKGQADSHINVKVYSLEYMLQPNINHTFVEFLKKGKNNVSKHINKAYIDSIKDKHIDDIIVP